MNGKTIPYYIKQLNMYTYSRKYGDSNMLKNTYVNIINKPM